MPHTTHAELFWEFVRKHPEMFVFYLLYLIVLPLQNIGLPHLYGRMVKAIQENREFKGLLIATISIIIIVQAVFTLIDWEEMRFLPMFIRHLHTRILRQVFDRYSTAMEEVRTGDMLTKIIKIPFAIYDYFDAWRYFLVPEIIVYVLTAVYLYRHDRWMGGVFGVIVGLIVAAVLWVPGLGRGVSVQRNQNYDRLHEKIEDMLRNMPAILNADRYEEEEDHLHPYQDAYAEYTAASMRYMLYSKMVFVGLLSGYLVFFFLRSYRLIRRRAMTAAVFVSLFTMMSYATGSMWRFVYQIRDLIFKIGVLEDSLGIMDPAAAPVVPVVPAPVPDGPGADGGGPVIRMAGVSFSYGPGKPAVLRDFSMDVRRGERVILTGPIGCGKSTVLKLIMRYYKPTAGQLYLDGVAYTGLSPHDIRARVGYVPQMPTLFDRTVYENINYGARHVSREEVLEVVAASGLGPVFDRLPEGLDTEVGKGGSRLSGGQRQVVWILRVLLQQPELLLLDEPTSSIDAETKENVQDLIWYAMQGRTVVGVTHDPQLLRMATRVVRMGAGA